MLVTFVSAQITTDCTNVAALYHLDGDANDDSGNNNNGTITGATYNSSGKVGGAYEFDGVDDYIQIDESDVLKLGGSDATFSAWIYPRTISPDLNMIIGNNFQDGGWQFSLAYSNKLALDTNGVSGEDLATSTGTLNTNEWYHVVAIWDNSTKTVQFYINGNDAGLTTNANSIIDVPGSFYIGVDGRDASGYGFDGLIDEVVVYDRTLTQNEVTELYNSSNGVSVSCGASADPTCSDGIQNQGETGIDCGGPCSACPVANCGNGNIEVGENCDGTDLAPYTSDCSTHPSFTGGTLTCYPQGHAQECTFDTSSCTILPPSGNTYYVSPTGSASWSQCTTSATHCSLDTANINAVAGDTIYLMGGTYNGVYINPSNSGTASQRIIYQNYQTEIVTIQNALYGIYLNGNDYITVKGIDFISNTYNLYILGGNNNIIAYCNFGQTDVGTWDASWIKQGSQYNWIHHSTFSKAGECTTSGSDNGGVLNIGDEENIDYTSYNLIEDSTFFHGGHHVVGLLGRYNTFRNNYIHNEVWSNGAGNRNLYLVGRIGSAEYNTIEGNRFGYAARPCDDPTVGNVAMSSPNNIFRYNQLYYHNAYGFGTYGYTGYTDGSDNRIYSNTIFNSGYNIDPLYKGGSEDSAVYFNHVANTGNTIKNNLYFSNYQVHTGYTGAQIFANNWDGDNLGDPLFVDASTTPLADKTDSTIPNLELQSSSPAIDKGGELTTVAIADTGTGTSLIVTDASYFQDGTWAPAGTVQADWIAVGTVDNTVQISSISGNTITLANTISRSDGAFVWLYKKSDGEQVLYGSAPDAGANEYVEVVSPTSGTCWNGGSTGLSPYMVVDSNGQPSVEFADVNYCVNTAASPGDTVYVTKTGSVTWGSTLLMTKGVKLLGPGKDKLIVTLSGGSHGIRIYPADPSKNHELELTGFRFENTACVPMVSLGYHNLDPPILVKQTKWRIHDNEFSTVCTSGNVPVFYFYGHGMYGLIDNNEIWTGSYTARFTANDGIEVWNYWGYWPGMEAKTQTGEADNVYIEDNVIHIMTDPVAASSQEGHRYVFRYNTFYTPGNSFSIWDAHGNYGSHSQSVIGVEIYGNLLINWGGNMLAHRGGQAIVFFNDANGIGTSMDSNCWEEADDSLSPPVTNQITGQPMHVWKSYYWGNRMDATGELMNVAQHFLHFIGNLPSQDVDFWTHHTWNEAGGTVTSGVGCGTITEMNAISTCSEGVGFWATSNPDMCSDLTNYVGANPTTPINGELYICDDANNWVAYYEPFTYPHPLRTGNTLPVPTCNDVDEDGYGNPASSSCTYPSLDCNDNDAAINPGATETCNLNVDDNCDGIIQCHNADYLIVDGCVDENEVDAFVQRWFVSSQDVSMRDLISAIRVWKAGC